MHPSIRKFAISILLISTLLLPAIGLASQPHSWCTTGEPLIKNDTATDAPTNTLIGYVCSNITSCCSDYSGTGTAHWGLSCVQTAANHAYTQGNGADYCGRYAWAQGPITQATSPGTRYNFKQYYPRDFNLVALSSTKLGGMSNLSVGGVRDIEGPIAAKGDALFNYFNLNYGGRDEIALLVGGKASLGNGTVNGTVQYGTAYSDPNITYTNGTRPPAATTTPLIDFGALSTSMVTLSKAFRDNYTVNGTVTTKSSTLAFTAATADPELNVFKFDASQLTGVTTFNFNSLPAGSAAIITVTGTSPVFKSAGIQWPSSASMMLWNFPDATTLTINGVGFPGSILAPNAVATLQNGSIRGTVVVASAPTANVELYSGPFFLGCSGGLCLDPNWSCSSNTVMADDGTAAAVESEAGFLLIEGGNYQAEGYTRTSPDHRVWYSFQPAKFGRKNKPLVVFFNGGPGGATTSLLFAFNTGPMTLDPQVTSSIATNPSSWTSFANLLYIDAPATGFSYPLSDATTGNKPDIGNDLNRDASNFLRVIIRFLARHSSLQQNPIIIAGESYGGMRATLMLDHLFNYASLNADHSSDGGYGDPQLYTELTKNYFSPALGNSAPATADIAHKFAYQVLIEPTILGYEQQQKFYTSAWTTATPQYEVVTVNPNFPMNNCNPPFDTDPKPCWIAVDRNDAQGIDARPPTCDQYNCKKDYQWSNGTPTSQEELAATKLTAVATLSQALNVNVKTIAWMNDQTRHDRAYGRASTTSYYVETATPIDLDSTSNFGPLNSDDNYLVVQNSRVFNPYGSCGTSPCTPPTAMAYYDQGIGAITGKAFANNVRNGVNVPSRVLQGRLSRIERVT